MLNFVIYNCNPDACPVEAIQESKFYYKSGGIIMEKKKHALKGSILKVIAGASEKTAESNINSACVWWLHQPAPPKAADKLKKFAK